MSVVELHDPRKFRDPHESRRVEVLHETVNITELEGERLSAVAMKNLQFWAEQRAAREGGTPAEPKEWADVLVVEGDLLETAQTLTKEHGVMFACLNMANAFVPGGGYTVGASAQEENLMRRSGIHHTFTDDVVKRVGQSTRYKDEMTALISGAYGRVYLSPNPEVCIRGREKYDELPDIGYELYDERDIFPFRELRSAAVDLRRRTKRKRTAEGAPLLEAEMGMRIRAQFTTLKEAGVRHVVLSAFGCGAFKNDPAMVARLYRHAIERVKRDFAVIAFAIYYAGNGPNNFEIFSRELEVAE